MIKANEIRLGNYIFEPLDNKIVKVEQICKLSSNSLNQSIGIRYNEWQNWSDLGNAQPIPLTEELLLKCGGTIEGNGYKNIIIKLDKKEGNGLILRSDGMFMLVINHAPMIIFEHIKYLHSLQNLYFALTGEELKINL
jgi:hypothetical protein